MTPKQSVFKVRRNYNQWVNNQTLEDYALRFTAKSARRFSFGQIANTAIGSISFLALEAIGAAITLNYGFNNAIFAIVSVSVIIFLLAIPICFYAAKTGLDIDLLTRGAGFGYLGSTITSLIYASFTFIFFALETAIMAAALKWIFGLPLFIGYVVCALVVIPLVTHGITFISRFQAFTQPIWVFLQVIPVGIILISSPYVLKEWMVFEGVFGDMPSIGHSFYLPYFGAACAVIFALVAQIGEQVDYLRFMPEKTQKNSRQWWLTLLAAGPGWVVIGAIKMLIGSLLATIAIGQGLSLTEAADPTRMYTIAFGYVIPWPQASLVVAAIFVVIAQLKINVTNAYAGSIAWSNFFARLTHSHPGRVVWLVFNVIIALVLMELGIYQAFEHILSGYALLAIAWLGALVGDLAINKPLKLSPARIEFIRAHLYPINPVGVVAMIGAGIVGLVCYVGILGANAQALAHFYTLIAALLLAPIIALLTRSKYYIARENTLIVTSTHGTQTTKTCCICQNEYDIEDIAQCPAYDDFICSLCCSLDVRCEDLCKCSTSDNAKSIIKRWLPELISEMVSARLLQFINLMVFAMVISGAILAVIYVNSGQQLSATQNAQESIATVLIQAFFVLQIPLGVIAWLFVLSNSSRRVAFEESRIQTQRLLDEITAHDKTDKQLQLAKEHAESANNAKSRYLTGLSHELRTPLNSVLGYAQLLEKDNTLDKNHKRQISVIKRSGEHLADLIEGLLDISRIEAGRLDIHRNIVNIREQITQLGFMFEPLAKQKGLKFTITYTTPLPDYVITDEKRFRQILINILSNAIKYTHKGSIDFTIRYRNQVAEFRIADTGIGIPLSERERIFKPFERVRLPGVPQVMGTGLGLTITRLLVDIMGGELRLESNTKQKSGTVFFVSLMLSSAHMPNSHNVPKSIVGFTGNAKKILILDDDPIHRALVFETLTPLGFIVFEAPDIEIAKKDIDLKTIDLFILDVNLPNSSGWDFANYLRSVDIQSPIIMASANADEGIQPPQEPHNVYLIKPIKINDLLHNIKTLLGLTWVYEKAKAHNPDVSNLANNDSKPVNERIEKNSLSTKNTLSTKNNWPQKKPSNSVTLDVLEQAYDYIDSGHLSGLKKYLKAIDNETLNMELEDMIYRLDIDSIKLYLESKINELKP